MWESSSLRRSIICEIQRWTHQVLHIGEPQPFIFTHRKTIPSQPGSLTIAMNGEKYSVACLLVARNPVKTSCIKNKVPKVVWTNSWKPSKSFCVIPSCRHGNLGVSRTNVCVATSVRYISYSRVASTISLQRKYDNTVFVQPRLKWPVDYALNMWISSY